MSTYKAPLKGELSLKATEGLWWRACLFHLSMISDEKKIGQTSDVFKNVLKRFKALK